MWKVCGPNSARLGMLMVWSWRYRLCGHLYHLDETSRDKPTMPYKSYCSAPIIQNVLVYALPKLKEARIVSIDKCIPTDCSIRTYRGFVEYWRKTVSAQLQLLKDFSTPSHRS